jgi:hypothetical protein
VRIHGIALLCALAALAAAPAGAGTLEIASAGS